MAVALLSLSQQITSGVSTADILPCNMSYTSSCHSKYLLFACELIPVMYAGTRWALALQA